MLQEIFAPYKPEPVYAGLKRRHIPIWLVRMECLDLDMGPTFHLPHNTAECFLCEGTSDRPIAFTICHEEKADLLGICSLCDDVYGDRLLEIIDNAVWAQQKLPSGMVWDPRIVGS